MFVLHCDIKVKPGADEAMAQTYRGVFVPAISKQNGFRAVTLLRALDGDGYILSISFESDELRMIWVDSDLHQEVWPQMEAHFVSVSFRKFNVVPA